MSAQRKASSQPLLPPIGFSCSAPRVRCVVRGAIRKRPVPSFSPRLLAGTAPSTAAEKARGRLPQERVGVHHHHHHDCGVLCTWAVKHRNKLCWWH
ncbi:hypothetical protein NDU88_004905 [Pleurodeles waltl]|uniref:Uncharacterized protein n=1 Tax=Pleurodeles waltl TaxID=8319 RepID=A0AAV7M7N6_PLEWA|nr:hypothetical protein NDU88_004905 [Pleurodeles waltl]